jgi:hypothetical protein
MAKYKHFIYLGRKWLCDLMREEREASGELTSVL